MIDIKESEIEKLLFARFAGGDSEFISEVLANFGDEQNEEVLKRFLLKPFVSNISTLEFAHQIDLAHNVLFNLSKSIY